MRKNDFWFPMPDDAVFAVVRRDTVASPYDVKLIVGAAQSVTLRRMYRLYRRGCEGCENYGEVYFIANVRAPSEENECLRRYWEVYSVSSDNCFKSKALAEAALNYYKDHGIVSASDRVCTADGSPNFYDSPSFANMTYNITYNIDFVNGNGIEDTMQFDAKDEDEALKLFADYCKENGLDGRWEYIEEI